MIKKPHRFLQSFDLPWTHALKGHSLDQRGCIKDSLRSLIGNFFHALRFEDKVNQTLVVPRERIDDTEDNSRRRIFVGECVCTSCFVRVLSFHSLPCIHNLNKTTRTKKDNQTKPPQSIFTL